MDKFKSNEIKVYKMTFTPELAKEIIDESDALKNNYRPVKAKVWENYAKDMEDGKWQFCGDSIRFDKNGLCIDGQHRLRAISASKKPQDFIVVEGLEPNVALNIDTGFKRSIEDYLKKQAEAYENGATAIVKQANVLSRGDSNLGQSITNLGLSYSDIVESYEKDREWYNNAAKYGKKISKESAKTLKPTEVGAIYYYLVRNLGYDADYVEDFFFKLCNSSRNDKSIYNLTMKNLGDKDYIGRSGVKRVDEFIQCWNAMRHGCTTQRRKYGNNWFEAPNSTTIENVELAMAEAE